MRYDPKAAGERGTRPGGPSPRARLLFLTAACALAVCACRATEPAAEAGPDAPAAEPAAGGPGAQGGAGSAAGAEGATAAPTAAQGEDEGRFPVHGWLSSRYVGRFTGDEDDHDLWAVLSLDIGDPERHRVTAHVMGRAIADLDGSNGDPDPFGSLQDTYDSALTGQLYSAYVDLHRVERLELLRFGRQEIFETPEFAFFDGVRLETEERGSDRLQFGLYGGIPVHLYESSSDGDLVIGTYAQARPWTGGRVRLDWMHLEDERLLAEHDDDLLGLGVWQSLEDQLLLEGQYTRLEGEDRDVRLGATWLDPEHDLIVRASYYSLLETQRSQALEVDPFFQALREYFPFHQATLLAAKDFGEHLNLEAGADVRRVDDDDDIGEFNRDFERYHLTAAYRGAFVEDLTLSATGDLWESDDLDIATWGADATHQVREDLSASIGSYYALYKQDLMLDEERDDVRTWYLRLRNKRSRDLSLDLGYEFEDNDFDEFHVVRLGATWRF